MADKMMYPDLKIEKCIDFFIVLDVITHCCVYKVRIFCATFYLIIQGIGKKIG